MWFASKVGEPGVGSSKSTEKFYIHVANTVKDVQIQLNTVASEDEVKKALIRPCEIATTNGQQHRIYLVTAQVVNGVIEFGIVPKAKQKSIVLSAANENDAIKRAGKYFQSIEPLKNASASEIAQMHKINKTNAKLLLFLD